MSVRTRVILGLVGGVLLVSLVGGGCDQVSRGPSDLQAPSVQRLEVAPDSVHLDDLAPTEVVGDSVAQVATRISVTAEDPDGRVERVVFTFEPASNPRGTASGQLEETEDGRYERQLGLAVPLRDEVYTVRVYAVDDDSLTSNQGIGRFRFATDSTATDSTTS